MITALFLVGVGVFAYMALFRHFHHVLWEARFRQAMKERNTSCPGGEEL